MRPTQGFTFQRTQIRQQEILIVSHGNTELYMNIVGLVLLSYLDFWASDHVWFGDRSEQRLVQH